MSRGFDTAAHLYEVGRYDQAASVLGVALAEDPDDFACLRLLALSQLNLGDHQTALNVVNRLVGAHPEASEGHRVASVVLQRIGNHEEAYRAATEAVRTGPLDPLNHVQVALTGHGLRGRRSVARAAALRAAELDPNDADAHFALGVTARRSGHKRSAYRQALAIDPGHAGAANNLQVARGRVLSLNSLASGYLAVLAQEPSHAVARGNLRVLAHRFVRRYYFFGLLLFPLSLLVAAITGAPWSPVGLGTGVVAVFAAVGYGWGNLRRLQPGPRSFLLGSWRGNARLTATIVHTAAVVGFGLVALLVPGGLVVSLFALFPLLLANLLLAVWSLTERRPR